MLFYLIMNLCAPFGVPFDPKRYYKDDDCAIILQRPRYEYTNSDIADFKSRLERIYNREIHRVQVVDFQGMPKLLKDGLFARMAMEHRDEAGVVVFTSQAWGGCLVLGDHWQCRRESLVLLGTGVRVKDWINCERGIYMTIMEGISTDGDFLGPPPSYTLIRDLILRLCHRMMAHGITGRSQAPEKICVQLDDTWAWVAMGPERQPDAMAGAPGVAQDAPIIDEGGQAVSAPVEAPQQPPSPPPAPARTMPQRMARLEEDVHEIRGALTEQHEVIELMAHDFSIFSTWVTTGLGRMMDRAGVTYTPYSQTHMSY
ncbi:hypothetical protein Tco_0375230 [Tanacetum coccineum]